eukprot:Awhi_evm1s15796
MVETVVISRQDNRKYHTTTYTAKPELTKRKKRRTEIPNCYNKFLRMTIAITLKVELTILTVEFGLAFLFLIFSCYQIKKHKSELKKDGNISLYKLKLFQNGLIIISILLYFPLMYAFVIYNVTLSKKINAEEDSKCREKHKHLISLISFIAYILSMFALNVFIWYRQLCLSYGLFLERKLLVKRIFVAVLLLMIGYITAFIIFSCIYANITAYECIFRVHIPIRSTMMCLWLSYNVLMTFCLVILGICPLLIIKNLKVRYRGFLLITCTTLSLLSTTLTALAACTLRTKENLPPTKIIHIFLSLDILLNVCLIHLACIPLEKIVALHIQWFRKEIVNKAVIYDVEAQPSHNYCKNGGCTSSLYSEEKGVNGFAASSINEFKNYFYSSTKEPKGDSGILVKESILLKENDFFSDSSDCSMIAN